MFKSFLERRRIKKTFERYVSPDIARQLADGTFTMTGLARTEEAIDFAFVAVSAADASSYSERAVIVTDIANQHEGLVHSLVPAIIVAFGSVHPAPPGARAVFVSNVLSRLPDSAAIVHGSIVASVGNFGGDRRADFSFWWPGAFDALRQLATLSPGDAHELANERSAS